MDPKTLLADVLNNEAKTHKEADAEDFDEGEPFNDDIPFG